MRVCGPALLLIVGTCAGCSSSLVPLDETPAPIPPAVLRMVCGDPRHVDLREVVDQVRLWTGLSIVMDLKLEIRVLVDEIPTTLEAWIPWLRKQLSPHPARLIKRGQAWKIEPSAELGPVLKELKHEEEVGWILFD